MAKGSRKKNITVKERASSSLRRGDKVMVISGGSKEKREVKGKTGTILRFVGATNSHVIVEGLNYVVKHTKAKGPGEKSQKVTREAPIHLSRLMYYVDKLKAPVRLKTSYLSDGRKVRGYKDKKTGEFVGLDT